MHGLVNRSLQCFIRDTYGEDPWTATVARAGLGATEFDSLECYDDALSEALIGAASAVLNKPRAAMLEDLGTYLVATPGSQNVRRLLRFSGTGFEAFLYALEDLPDRARLAIPDLDLPALELRRTGAGEFVLAVRWRTPDAACVLIGLLRAMADDYGALALFEHAPGDHVSEAIRVQLLDTGFAEGRRFDLAGAAR